MAMLVYQRVSMFLFMCFSLMIHETFCSNKTVPLGTSQKKLLFPSRSFWGPSDDWWSVTLGDERTR